MSRKITSSIVTVAEYIGSRTGSMLASVAKLLVSLGITLGLLFFFVRDAASFAEGLRRNLPFGRERNQRIVYGASALISASVTSTLVIAVIQGVIGGSPSRSSACRVRRSGA